ncbi:polysaccharide pyruvyl transferase family protein [Paraburkholderia kururiensis]|uniref:polysaccharide pyruvyl transferase family protein n=1 Tax=Paraburkholderia kururiensis TaxID=984307 RepID=UPI0005AB923C|nr:polysaccharide pyruvyl transferase family protein [Paraburkholderia kururiensis]
MTATLSSFLADDATRSMAALQRYVNAPDPDAVFLDDMLERIEAARRRPCSPRPPRPRTGRALRVLLLSYAGAGNTGADLRTIETIRHLQRLFGDRDDRDDRGEGLRIELFALGGLFDHPVLAATPRMPVQLPYVPDAFAAAIPGYDLVLNVEGSTYTSKFSDSLSGMLIGGVALASVAGAAVAPGAANGDAQVSGVAWGIDSGEMTEALARFARAAATGAHIFCRNDAAREHLASLDIASLPGADCAWSWTPVRTARVAALPANYVALCPNNPFWWPVTADVARAKALDAQGASSPLRYGPFHFHTWDDAREAAYDAYVERFAGLAERFRRQGFPPVLVAMERLDRAACEAIAARVPFDVPIMARGTATLDDVAGTVAHAARVVTTRYHAAVVAIASRVPVFGLSMDARIDRLLTEGGLPGWFARCTDPDGGERALARLCQPQPAIDALRDAYALLARREQMRLGQMGEWLAAAVGPG